MSCLQTAMVADVSAGQESMATILRDRVRLVHVAGMDGALAALGEGVGLVLCGVHFDESRMFDLLRLAKADKRFRSIPFICYRDLQSELAPPLLESLRIACTALGAEAFIDLYALKQRVGIHAADDEFRRLVEQCFGKNRPPEY